MSRKQRIHPDASDDTELILNVHPTSKVLSQKRDEWVFDRLYVRYSSASQFRTSPSRSRSLVARVP